MKSAVCLVSGGIDSTVLVSYLLNSHYKIRTLSFYYGQKHAKELLVCKQLMKKIGVIHKYVDISGINPLLKSSLTSSFIDITENAKTTIVPNRNSIFLSIAGAYAVSLGLNTVCYAAHKSDREVYPDCREEFVESFQKTLRLGTGISNFTVLVPFLSKTKGEIIKLGEKLGVRLEETWSCYKGGEKHCGVCAACVERKKGFKEANVIDRTEYEQ